MSKMFEMLKGGFEDALNYERGKKILRVKRVIIPEPPKHYNAENIKKLRSNLGMSQSDFALWLNVSLNTVKSWEQSVRTPSHSALRLLEFFERGYPFVKQIYNIPDEELIKAKF